MSGEYSTAKLPTGYTQVEYLESTGTQYIDTNFIPNQDTRIKVKIMTKDISGMANKTVFGSRESANSKHYSVTMGNGSQNSWWTGYGTSNIDTNSYALRDTLYEIEKNKNVTILNGSVLATNESQTFTCPSNLYLFCMNQSGPKFYSNIELYLCEMWDNDILVRNFIPCKNPSNVIGLYDTVNDVFYSNAGTGSFIAGAEVETVYGVIPIADYKDICDAVREKTHTDALMLPPEVAAKIRSINPTPTPGEWVRPESWPDLDSIDLTGFDGVYLTYDLSKTEGYGWIGLYATTADRTSWTVERGHLEAGQFVAERTEQTASGGHFRESLDDTYGTIQLWRVSASGHITELKFVTMTATSASNMDNNLQPCVERVGRLPYAGNFSSSLGTAQTNRCWGTLWMQHDKLLDVSSVTTLSGAWNGCCSLQSLDISGWDTGSVTTLQDAWRNCYSLQSLDLSGWDTGSVTALQGTWNACYSLQSLNLSGWDVSSVTNMAYAWENCYRLQSLDLSGWDVSSVTNMTRAWQNCNNLQSINLSGWDVSHLSTNVAYPNGYMLADYWPSVISINQKYSSAAALSIASLLRIIDSLPVVTGTRTLTLGQINKLKLTAEQIAVATQKGWTVA